VQRWLGFAAHQGGEAVGKLGHPGILTRAGAGGEAFDHLPEIGLGQLQPLARGELQAHEGVIGDEVGKGRPAGAAGGADGEEAIARSRGECAKGRRCQRRA
jgi:hypothetical protein